MLNGDLENYLSPWTKSFIDLKEYMMKIPNANIYKKLLNEGLGEMIPQENKVRVVIHYNAFWENENTAFDSTYLRGECKRFITKEYDVLPGIELSIMTMKKGEESQFLISYEYLFGKMGCPPRALPEADGLFIIKLLDFTEIGNDNALNDLTAEDKQKFSVVIKKVNEVHLKGTDHFKQGNISSATRSFQNAVRSLEFCKLENESEQLEQQELLLRLYTNLAVCYNKMNLPKRACLMCNEIARISNIQTNCKALFQDGRALLIIGDYEKAKRRLQQALRLEPNNETIVKELRLLSEKHEKDKENERAIWKRVFDKENVNKSKKISVKTESEVQFKLKKHFEDFKNNDKEKSLVLPEGLDSDELKHVEKLVNELSLKLKVCEMHNNKTSHIVYKK